jgi:hypothetical protein
MRQLLRDSLFNHVMLGIIPSNVPYSRLHHESFRFEDVAEVMWPAEAAGGSALSGLGFDQIGAPSQVGIEDEGKGLLGFSVSAASGK